MLGLYRLATVKRYDGDDLRDNWAEYNEHNFVNIRVWTPGDDGAWFPVKGKGLTVRLPDLKGALVQDCDHANGHDYDRCDVFFPQLAAVRSS